jgi:hypothetical protein
VVFRLSASPKAQSQKPKAFSRDRSDTDSTVVGKHAYLVLRESDREHIGPFFDRESWGLSEIEGPVAQLVRAHA